jgi:hypothetical protein
MVLLLTSVHTFLFGIANAKPDSLHGFFKVESISADSSVVVTEFRPYSGRRTQVTDLVIWKRYIGIDDPLSCFFAEEPDVRMELIVRGIARLRDTFDKTSAYAIAQSKARAEGIGLWPAPKPDTHTPVRAKTASDRTGHQTVPWGRIKELILFYGGLGTVIAAAAALIRWLSLLIRRRRLLLIFLGLQSAGKSWLWSRMINPEITHQELNAIPRSQVPTKRAKRSLPMGRYEVTPLFHDLPGAKPEEHINALLGGKGFWARLFSRRRVTIWIIQLATTESSTVRVATARA